MFARFKWPRRSNGIALVALAAVHAALAVHLVDTASRFQSYLLRPLAARFRQPLLDPDTTVSGIIVLGGGFERTREGVRLQHSYPGALLVVSGANDYDYAYARANAADPARVIVEPDAKSTFDNARLTRRLLRPQPGERWLLVTSASHMPRAYLAFDGAGFPVIPWPVFEQTGSDQAEAEQATHEILGLIGYRLLGRTRKLWPSPPPEKQARVALSG